jgi:multidrug efflux pump subunit AcrB
MSLVSGALKRPITVVVINAGLAIFSIISILNIPIDIFPKLNSPTIYVIESYGGMSAQQMEGFFSTRLQDQFLYVSGIKNIESKNIQGLTIVKLVFYENANMAEASAEVALQVNRAMGFFPQGALPPQVIRYDASSLPIGELVFSSPTKSLNEIDDLAITRVRPMFAKVPGLTAPPPFGGNLRSVVINLDPDKLRSFNLTPDQVVESIAKNNVMTPSGNIRINNTMFITSANSLEQRVSDFEDIPVHTDAEQVVYVKDIATVEDAADVTVDYALVNGKRSIYIPIVKTADASTWDVVQSLKKTIPEMQSLLPDDVHISYEFDQSVFVINAVKSLMTEGILGALLTGLMVLLFLRDLRSTLIVVITIPISITIGILFLSLAGQTINIMTLSGLALAIGILVDQATVTIENIHQHIEMRKPLRLAIYDACEEISFPLLLILLCVLAVFAPSFVMNGVPKAMFLPLSLAIGFAMIVSFMLAQTMVPVMSNWLLKHERYIYEHGEVHAHAGEALDKREERQIDKHLKKEEKEPAKNDFFEKVKIWYRGVLEKMMRRRKSIVLSYFIVVFTAAALCFTFIGKDLMPHLNVGQFQLRIRMPDGTRLERTEDATHKVLDIIDSAVGGHVAITSAYVGLVPSSYGTSNLYVFNSGTNEAVIQVNLDKDYHVDIDRLKDTLRHKITAAIPNLTLSFEPIDLTEKIMSQGAATPIEIRVAGKDMGDIEKYSTLIRDKMRQIPYLRDVNIAQPLKYPTISITLDRYKIASMGLDVAQVARSVTASTSSSRFTEKNLWLDPKVSYTYQVQVEIPEYIMNDMSSLREIPLLQGQDRPILSDVADFKVDSLPAEYDREGPRRYVTINANIYKKDLGTATRDVEAAVNSVGTLPKGTITEIKGTSNLLLDTFSSLQNGLAIAILVIFLLLAANYQSFKLSLSVLTTIPAVITGSLLFLLMTGSTLNLQSYMGMIMSTGVSVANAILIVTNAEKLRHEYKDPLRAAITAGSIRLRPILMTSMAMIAGMIPMASGLGEAGDQTAPLGRAVIGGLLFSTLSALFILPLAYELIQHKSSYKSVSLMPEEKQ